jgi:hypothetical protein
LRLQSFDELREEHGLAGGSGAVRTILSLLAAMAVLGGLILIIPLGT